MAEWLIVRMPRAAETAAAWLTVDATGLPLSAVQEGPLERAAPEAAGRRVAVVVNPADVLCLDVELPPRSGARAAELAPFAIEERIASEIEAQHCALGVTDKAGRTRVAVVARSFLEHGLQQLSAAGLEAELLCSEAELLPRSPAYAVALLDGDMLSVSGGDGPALSISAPPGGFSGALAIACGEAAATTDLLLYMSSVEWKRRSAEIESARAGLGSLKLQLLGSGPLPWLAAQLPAAAPINLLQGSYAPRGNFSAHWQRWRIAAALAASLLLLHVGTQAWSLWQLNRAEREVNGLIGELVAPQWTSGNDSIRERVEQVLLAAEGRSGRSGLLPALQVLAQAMSAVPGSRLQALSFRDGALQLKVRAGDAQSLDRINQSLRSAGWQAELVSGTPAGDAFEGNVQLRAGPS
jgi:general secretion pathway protein L